MSARLRTIIYTAPIGSVPGTPVNLVATTVSASAINVSWDAPIGSPTSYTLQRAIEGDIGGYSTIATQAGTTFADTGLTGGTLYDYRVLATNAFGNSSYSDVAQATTSSPGGVPGRPTSLVATAVSDVAINLTWVRADNNETSLLIQRNDGSGMATLTTRGAGENIWTDTSLTPGVSPVYQITAINGSGSSTASATATATTPASSATAAVPDTFTATPSGAFQVNLSFVDHGTDTRNYEVDRRVNGTLLYVPLAMLSVSGAAPVTVTWQDRGGNEWETGPVPATSYDYRIRHLTGSEYSNYVTATSAATAARTASGALEATGLTAVPISATQVSLSWADTNSGLASYKIELAPVPSGGTNGYGATFAQTQQTAVGATSATVTVSAGYGGYIRVRGSRAAADSAYTPPVWFCTPQRNATNTTWDIGPGQTYTSIGAFPWSSVGPGDTVRLHGNGSTPYAELFTIACRGLASALITIIGVVDGLGNYPIVSGLNAVENVQFQHGYQGTESGTTGGTANYGYEGAGVCYVGTNATYSAGYQPGWLTISHITFQAGSPANGTGTFTYNSAIHGAGWTGYYANATAGIYLAKCDNVTISCWITGNGNGIFGAAKNDDNFRIENTTIDSCSLTLNGISGSFSQHTIYLEGQGTVYQYNRIGPLATGALGAGIKDRGRGTVIRYNWIDGGTFLIDLVEVQNALNNYWPCADYRMTPFFGNIVLCSNANAANLSQMMYIGGDSSGDWYYRQGIVYAWNNTIVTQADSTSAFYMSVFGTTTAVEAIDCRNNVIYFVDNGSGTAPELDLLSAYGTAFFGVNWVSPGWVNCKSTLTFTGKAAGTGSFISTVGNLPGFVSAATQDFHLTAGSPCLNVSTGLAALLGGYPLNNQYLAPNSSATRANVGGIDLGAFERP